MCSYLQLKNPYSAGKQIQHKDSIQIQGLMGMENNLIYNLINVGLYDTDKLIAVVKLNS